MSATIRAENLKPGTTYVDSRRQGRVFTRTVQSVSTASQFGRRVSHVRHEWGVSHIPSGQEMELHVAGEGT